MNKRRFTTLAFWLLYSGFCILLAGCASSKKVSSLNQQFAPFPSSGLVERPILPTDNEQILAGRLDSYIAQAGGNSNYGMPGWSRNQGTRFHEGVDIKPVSTVATKRKIKVTRKDPVSGRLVTRVENVRVPKDKVYAVLEGVVVITSTDPSRSGYGKYVMIEHAWSGGAPFLTLYAHLSAIHVREGQAISQGTVIGVMGQTAKDATSRHYLAGSPHLHFEVGRLIHPNTTAFANKYDPRNMQPYNPVDFLKRYDAMPRRTWAAAKSPRPSPIATAIP